MVFSKRKATSTFVVPRKIRRFEGDDSDTPRPSSDLQGFASARDPNAHTRSGDDSDVSPSFFAQDNVPPRTKAPAGLPKPVPVAKEIKFSSAASNFAELGVSPPLVRALATMSIRTPTPVQAACIPPLIAGQDCIGNAKTGSGKTVAFAIPILQRLASDPYGIYAVVLTPTRELAFQISEQFAVLGSTMNIKSCVVVGGMDMMTQAAELRARPHVVIATPGRLVDLMESGSGEWDLSRVKFLILDEADRLLTDTFASNLKAIFASIPSERHTGLFTATITPTIENLALTPPRPGKQKPILFRDASVVETVETLQQFYFLVPTHAREVYLYYLLCNPPKSILHLRREPPPTGKAAKTLRRKSSSSGRRNLAGVDPDDPDAPPKQPPPTIIFVRHPRTAAYLTILLQHLEIRATALHSYLSQPARLSSLQLFRASVVPVLVCTDVASRGLDMEGVGLVINWDMPTGKRRSESSTSNNEALGSGTGNYSERASANGDDVGGAEEYVHRVGRTARMGKGGVAISFITERREDAEMVKKVEARIRTQLIEYTMPEKDVLEKLNLVSTAKRTANMELNESDFGKRQEINRMKKQSSK